MANFIPGIGSGLPVDTAPRFRTAAKKFAKAMPGGLPPARRPSPYPLLPVLRPAIPSRPHREREKHHLLVSLLSRCGRGEGSGEEGRGGEGSERHTARPQPTLDTSYIF